MFLELVLFFLRLFSHPRNKWHGSPQTSTDGAGLPQGWEVLSVALVRSFEPVIVWFTLAVNKNIVPLSHLCSFMHDLSSFAFVPGEFPIPGILQFISAASQVNDQTDTV